METDPDIDDAYRKFVDLDGSKVLFDVTDTATPAPRLYNEGWVRAAEAYLICFALNDRNSFEEVEQHIIEIERMKEAHVPILLVGTKCDLEEERVVQTKEVIDLVKKYDLVGHIDISAKLRINVDEAMFQIARKCLEKQAEDLRKSQKSKEKTCCIF